MHRNATKQQPAKRAARSPHILRWIREQLGLSQSELGKIIGSSQPTIQSIELGRLLLSERFAYRLQQELGLSAKWLMSNDWNNLPDPAEVREKFRTAWLGGVDQSYLELEVMRLNLLRDYLLLRAVIDELGFHGCNATGFHTILRKAITHLLGTISDKRVRDRLYQKHIDQAGNPLTVLKVVGNDVREMRQYFRGIKTERSPEQLKVARDARARLQAAPSPPNNVRRSS